MTRDIYLVVYPPDKVTKVNAGRAHWAIWIPEPSSPSGKVIHVVGSVFTGYGLEFKRSYNISRTKRPVHSFLLASIDDAHIKDTPGGVTNIEPEDTLEAEAKKIDAPTASPEPFNPNVGKRCQDWTREYVEALIRKGILPKDAVEKLDEAKALETANAGAASSA